MVAEKQLEAAEATWLQRCAIRIRQWVGRFAFNKHFIDGMIVRSGAQDGEK